jgi:1,2-beta-oligoglucan phosphorylase
MEWISTPTAGLTAWVTLALHPDKAAWAWHVLLHRDSGARLEADVLMAQDFGLGNLGAVRNSEAFTSQYVDLLPVEDPLLGWVVLARQNLQMGGKHPWLATACAGGATAFCTDAAQFFGVGHRLSGVPVAVVARPCGRNGFSMSPQWRASRAVPCRWSPERRPKSTFVARFLPDHPEASRQRTLPTCAR